MLLYIFLAHTRQLPALFEKFTGDLVRNKTENFYEVNMSGLLAKAQTGQFQPSAFYMSVVDTVAREPSYLYVQDILKAVQTGDEAAPEEVRDDLHSIVTYPALLEWIRNPKGSFAEVFKYEFIRYVKTFDYIQDFRVVTRDRNILWKIGEAQYENGLGEIFINAKGFSQPIYHDGILKGYIQGGWDRAKMIKRTALSDLAYGVKAFILNSNFELLDANMKVEEGSQLSRYIRDNAYIGPLSGRHSGYRFIHTKSDYSILFIYPATPVTFYLLRILLALILAALCLYLYYYLKNNWRVLFPQKNEKRDAEQLLQSSIQLNADAINFVRETQRAIVQIKETELEKVMLISGHISFMHKKLNNLLQDDNLLDRS